MGVSVSSWKVFSVVIFLSMLIFVEIKCTLQRSESDVVLIQGSKSVLNSSRGRLKREVGSLSKIRNSGRGRCGKVRVKQNSNNKKEASLESVLVNLISAYDLNRKRAGLGEFPWIAALVVHKHGQTFYCGGSLIDHWHVLTAASCVATLLPEDLRNMKILLGTYDIYNSYEINRVEARVAQVAYHKDFDSLRMENNIALIKLTEPIRYSDFIQPICLPNGTSSSQLYLNSNDQGVLAGWGQLLFEPLEYLHKINLQVWKEERCTKRYNGGRVDEEFPEIGKDSMCAGTPVSRSKSLCQGNNGAPLVVKRDGRFTLVGIVSWGIGADKYYPCVFTRVDLHAQWIQRGIASFD